ncbi:TrmB family transcriptional regulator [Fusobacterium sp.]|uniref:TrmB family transcriptional regulator n=1 Tax=Fusobacterium sp. TaxID=68766 RepID=UPI0025BC53FA|nr:helix-turn-helix domain-containing protein [Fusobacterium sp.]
MEKIIEKLKSIGLTKTEALIYTTLLMIGRASGYRLAKELEFSKSTIYQVLDTMCKNGYILLIPNTCKEYEAKDPELLLDEMEKRYLSTFRNLKNNLKDLNKSIKTEYFYKLDKRENINRTLVDIIDKSEREIYINTDFNLQELRETLEKALKRGVRIILFSFNKLDNLGLNIEVYHKSQKKESYKNSSRLMLVADLKKSLIITKIGEKFSGICTDNQIFIKIISEHIHSDIYMAKLSKIYEEIFDDKIKIDTLHERRNLIK